VAVSRSGKQSILEESKLEGRKIRIVKVTGADVHWHKTNKTCAGKI